MDFLERFFGCSPDGGSGMVEVFLLLAVAAAIAGVTLRVAFRRKPFVAIGRRLVAGLSLERS